MHSSGKSISLEVFLENVVAADEKVTDFLDCTGTFYNLGAGIAQSV
jgi:hypothetical protein